MVTMVTRVTIVTMVTMVTMVTLNLPRHIGLLENQSLPFPDHDYGLHVVNLLGSAVFPLHVGNITHIVKVTFRAPNLSINYRDSNRH